MMFKALKIRFLKTLLVLCLGLSANFSFAANGPINVTFLTHEGSRVLKSWTPAEITKFAGKKRGEFSSQKFLFDISTEGLDLSLRASIDLLTITTDHKVIRVPRFLVWRGYFQFLWNAKTGELSCRVRKIDPGSLIVPISYFDAGPIRKIELSEHTLIYPQSKLELRTNPAASRGEKLFTQSCMACHSTGASGAKSLSPFGLTHAGFQNFSLQHKKVGDLKLDSRSERGLVAYSEALALEKPEEKKRR